MAEDDYAYNRVTRSTAGDPYDIEMSPLRPSQAGRMVSIEVLQPIGSVSSASQ